MAETNNPLGTDLFTAQNAIRQMIAPQEDTATEPNALEAEAEEVIEAEAEMPEGEEEYQEYDAAPEGEPDGEGEAEEFDDQSFDLLGQIVEVDGEEMTVEELRRGNLRQKDYAKNTRACRNSQRDGSTVSRVRA